MSFLLMATMIPPCPPTPMASSPTHRPVVRQVDIRCPVVVHELVNGRLAVSYQGQRIALFDQQGNLVPPPRAVA
jgi:hypothetical protein